MAEPSTDPSPAAPSGSSAAAPSQPPPRAYSLSRVASVLSSDAALSRESLERSADSVLHSSCFRSSFLWASAMGGLFAAHRFKQGGRLLRVANDGVLALMATFGVQWYLCREGEVEKRLALRAFYAQQARKSGVASMGSAAGVPSAPGAGGASDGGVSEEAVRQELARLTTYDLPLVLPGPLESVRIREK